MRADLAQLVEQLIRNEQVVGSSPTSSSKKKHFFGSAFSMKFAFRRVKYPSDMK